MARAGVSSHAGGKNIVGMIQGELLPQAILTLVEGGHPAPHCGHMLVHRQVEALNERGVDLAAPWSQHRIDGLHGAKHHAVPHPHQAPAPHGFDHLCIERLRERHPVRLRRGPWAWRRSGRTQRPEWVSKAVRYSRKPSVSKSGAPSGSNTCATCGGGMPCYLYAYPYN